MGWFFLHSRHERLTLGGFTGLSSWSETTRKAHYKHKHVVNLLGEAFKDLTPFERNPGKSCKEMISGTTKTVTIWLWRRQNLKCYLLSAFRRQYSIFWGRRRVWGYHTNSDNNARWRVYEGDFSSWWRQRGSRGWKSMKIGKIFGHWMTSDRRRWGRHMTLTFLLKNIFC